jgi:nucleoside-diphosphate-sugar epimerase
VTLGTLAITGGTGFVGAEVLHQAIKAGWSVKALTRRPQTEQPHITWINGTLDDQQALQTLCIGADAIIHIAGVTNTPDRSGFINGNVTGTQNIVTAAIAAGVKRFIHVSSLSAREPQLSDYGWSKLEGERCVTDSVLDWTIIRPPGVFGPGDVDHLDLFKSAKWGIIPLPPKGQISEVYVRDLAQLLLALPHAPETIRQSYDADDGKTGGWTHEEFAQAIARAMGKKAVPLHLPAIIVKLGARLDRILRKDQAKLTPDRASYLCHPNWAIDPQRRPPATVWTPATDTHGALAETVAAYKKIGWL